MSHFYGTMKGTRGTLSPRCGDKKNGLLATINGWRQGVTVRAEYDEERQQDVFHIWLTCGLSPNKTKIYLGAFVNFEKEGGDV